MMKIFRSIKSLFDGKTAFEDSLKSTGEKFISKGDVHLLVALGDIESIKTFLDRGFDINSKNSMGNTLAHIAIEFNKATIFQLCVDRNADFNIKNNEGKTVLELLKEKSIS